MWLSTLIKDTFADGPELPTEENGNYGPRTPSPSTSTNSDLSVGPNSAFVNR